MPIVSKNQNEFMAGLDALLQGQPEPTNVPATLPETQNALRIGQQAFQSMTGAATGARMPPASQQDYEAMRLGVRPGVPLDIEFGIPPTTLLAVELNRRREDMLRELQKVYGKEHVDLSPQGDFVLRNIQDEHGQIKDILVKPEGLGLDDAITLAAKTPEILAAALSLRGRNPKGVWESIKALTRMSTASEAAGALKDVGVRKAEGMPTEPGEIARSRALLSVEDFAAGGAMGLGLGTARRILSPMSEKGLAASELEQGRKFLRETWGLAPAEEITPTAGQATGNPLLLRMEARARQMPGSAVAFENFEAANRAKAQSLLRRFFGLPPDASEEEIAKLVPSAERTGQEAMGTIGAKATTELEAPLQRARKAALETGTLETQALAGAGGAPIPTAAVGAGKRARAVSDFDAFHEQFKQVYTDFLNRPELVEKNMPGDAIADAARKLYKSLPTKTVEREEALKLLDPITAKPITVTRTGKEPVADVFLPKGVRARLEEMMSWKGQQFSLDELKQIRTAVDDAIAEGISIPHTNVSFLKRMRGIVNEGIEKGFEGLNKPALKAEWDKINADYAAGITKFEPPAIRRLLVKPSETNLGDVAIAEDAFKDPDVYNAYRKYFGDRSPQMGLMRTAIAQRTFSNGFDKGSGYVKAKDFLAQLKSMHPDIKADVFPNEEALTQALQAHGIAEGAFTVDELANLASNKSLTYQKVLDYLSAQQTKAQAYKNLIVRKVASRNLDADTIEPSQFVSWFVRNADPKTIVPVRDWIMSEKPQLWQDIQRRVGIDLLQSTAAVQSEIGSMALPGAEELARIMRLQSRDAEKYRFILGDKTYDSLDALRKILAMGERQFTSFSGAGGLAASTQIGRIFEKGEVNAITRAIGNWALATIYTSPVMRKYVENAVVARPWYAFGGKKVSAEEATARALNTVFSSTPFVEQVMSQYGHEKGKQVMGYLGGVVDPYLQNVRGAAGQPSAPQERSRNQAEFLRGLNAIAPETNAPATNP